MAGYNHPMVSSTTIAYLNLAFASRCSLAVPSKKPARVTAGPHGCSGKYKRGVDVLEPVAVQSSMISSPWRVGSASGTSSMISLLIDAKEEVLN